MITLIICDHPKKTCFLSCCVYAFFMATKQEQEIAKQIVAHVDIVFALEDAGINPIIVDLLNQITLDTYWLIDRLWETWSLIESYQNELQERKNENS